MHAAFPRLTKEFNQVVFGMGDAMAGEFVAGGMALLIKLGFRVAVIKAILEENDFFRENFVIKDPLAPSGERFYQGKFLIRTKEEDDDMNVLIRFCPDPKKFYVNGFFNPLAKVVSAKALDEKEADKIDGDPRKVDIVIRFKDVGAITGLVGRPNIDMASLLLENLVQITGNAGHLFKLGAIAKNIELLSNGH